MTKRQYQIFYKILLISSKYRMIMSRVEEDSEEGCINILWSKLHFMMDISIYDEDEVTFSFQGPRDDRVQIASFEKVENCERLFKELVEED